jgi:hypothetical protein
MGGDTDFARYLDARWADLVGGLEDEGVPADHARLSVAETLLASRRTWSRRVREEQVDVSLWAELRERTGLPPRPGEAVPHAVRPFDPRDTPDAWLARASELRAARRRRSARRSILGLAVVAVVAAGWLWWAARPAVPEVREEANPLPVVWYAEGDLHLAKVVVELPGIDEFVAWGSGVAVRLGSGELVRVDADGDVHHLDEAPAVLDATPDAPPFLALGEYDVLVQSVPVPGGGWAHLLDSSRRGGERDEVRQSESGRRAIVICTADFTCNEPRTISEAGGSILLR